MRIDRRITPRYRPAAEDIGSGKDIGSADDATLRQQWSFADRAADRWKITVTACLFRIIYR